MVYALDNDCAMTRVGQIPVSKGLAAGEVTNIPAEQPFFGEIKVGTADYISHTNSHRTLLFSIVPRDRAVYEIRYIDNPSSIRIEVYETDAAGDQKTLLPSSWNDRVDCGAQQSKSGNTGV